MQQKQDVDTWIFAKEVDLANLKSEVDKLDIDKLEKVQTDLNRLKSKVDELDVDKLVPVPVDLCKLSDVVKNDVVKMAEYDDLAKKVNAIQTTDTTNLVKKLTMPKNLMKLKKLLLITILINILAQSK